MSGVTYKAILEGAKELQAILADVPDRVQNRVFRFAGRKVGDAIAKRTMAILRSELQPHRDIMGPRRNRPLRESYINKQIVYRRSATTVNIVGGQTGRMGNNRVNHLVEHGTKQRFTAHKSKYETVPGQLVIQKRRTKTANGWKTVKTQVRRSVKRSIGSFATGRGIARNRGTMPAFNQLSRAVAETPVADIYDKELRAGLQRIFDRAAKAG
jgi:hypothetical protein